jgi:hypothetical protein
MEYNVSTIIHMLQNYSNKLKILTTLEGEKKMVLYNGLLYLDSYSFLDLASDKIKYHTRDVVDFIANKLYCYFDNLLLLWNIYKDDINSSISTKYNHQDCYINYIISFIYEYKEDLNKFISCFNAIFMTYHHDNYIKNTLNRIIGEYNTIRNTIL